MYPMDKELIVLNALLLKSQGIEKVYLYEDPYSGLLGLEYSTQSVVDHSYLAFMAPTWESVVSAARDLDVSYKVFPHSTGLKASVTKDVDGVVIRLAFSITNSGTEQVTILKQILNLYLRSIHWVLDPKKEIPGYAETSAQLFPEVTA